MADDLLFSLFLFSAGALIVSHLVRGMSQEMIPGMTEIGTEMTDRLYCIV